MLAHGADPPASPPASVDHVWANARVFLPGGRLPAGRLPAACQLGGDRLGPHLAELASLAVVVAPSVRAGPGWRAVPARPDRAPFADGCFDLVAVEDLERTGRPPGRVLDEARRLCRPTGSLLVGFRAGLAGRAPAGVRAVPGVALAALPGPGRPAFLLRPGDREAARYFVRRIAFAYRTGGGPRARVRRARVRVRQACNRAALAAPPTLALRAAPGRLVALPGASAPRRLVDGVVDLVCSSWDGLELPGRPPARLGALVVGHRRPTTGTVAVLLFRPGDRAPAVVAKLPRYGASAPALEREAHALDGVRAVVRGPVRHALPRPLGLHDVDGIQVLLQTGVPGRHLVAETASGRLRPARVAAQLDLVLSWWLALQGASRRLVVVDEALIAARLEALVAAGLAALGGDPAVAGLLDRVLERARGLVGTPLPLVASHGDYWAGNVLVEAGEVCGVVDWERAAVDDLPIWDPVKAVGSAAYHLDRYRSLPRRGAGALPGWGDLGRWAGSAEPQFATGFRAAFVQASWLADSARQALAGAFRQAGIPLAWLPVAVPLYLVRQVVQATDSPRSVQGWGSVLRALAAWPGTWADELAGRPPARPAPPAGAQIQERSTP